MDQMIEKFISNPENFALFRGERNINRGGLHFTTDKDWAKNFGQIILEGKLPANSKIKLLTEADLKKAYKLGFTSEQQYWDWVFTKDYDAIIGTDFMDSSKLDVIINPKHLQIFKS